MDVRLFESLEYGQLSHLNLDIKVTLHESLEKSQQYSNEIIASLRAHYVYILIFEKVHRIP